MNKYCWNYNGLCEDDHCYCSEVKEGLKKDRPVMLKAWGELWSKINSEKSWEQNNFVWAISFERVNKPENFI